MWCRSCGARSLAGQIEQLELIASDTFWSNPGMECLNCSGPGLNLSPTAKRVEERILFYMMTKGVVRVGFGSRQGYDVETKGDSDTARNYIGQAAATLDKARRKNALEKSETHRGIRFSTHHRTEGYVIGHIAIQPNRCNCKMV